MAGVVFSRSRTASLPPRYGYPFPLCSCRHRECVMAFPFYRLTYIYIIQYIVVVVVIRDTQGHTVTGGRGAADGPPQGTPHSAYSTVTPLGLTIDGLAITLMGRQKQKKS